MIRLGLVGVGRWGRRYIDTIARRRDCELAGIARSRQGQDAPLSPARNYQDWRALVDAAVEGQVDGLIVSTTPTNQAEVAATCLDHGVPVLVEKPLGSSRSEADGVLACARLAARPVPLFVDFIHLWSPAYRALKQRITQAGTDFVSSVVSEGYNWGPFRDWSPIYDYGSHDVALVLDLLGRKAEWRVLKAARRTDASIPGGELVEADLLVDQTPVSLTVGNLAKVKARRLVVTLQSGRRIVYDDLNPPERKLVDDGVSIGIGSGSTLDVVLTEFLDQVDAYRKGNFATSTALEWIELSVTASSILDALIAAANR